jgi:hypothetical protein
VQPARGLGVLGAQRRHADEAVGRLERRGRGEGLPVQGERGPGVGGAAGAEVIREGKRQAEPSGQLGAVAGRPEQPQGGLVALGRDGADPGWVVVGCLLGEVGLEIRELSGEVRRRQPVGGAPQCPRRCPVGAGSAADPEVDPSGVQRLKGAELLRHGQRRMVGEHHPARADPDRVRRRREPAGQDGRGRAGDAGQVVVLRHPVPGETQALGVPGQIDAAAKRLAGRCARGHRAQVEHRQRNGEAGGHKQKTASTGRPRQPGPERGRPARGVSSRRRRSSGRSGSSCSRSSPPPRCWSGLWRTRPRAGRGRCSAG